MSYRLAKIEAGVVVNVIMANSPSFPGYVDVTGVLVSGKPVSIGYLFDGASYSIPPPPPPPPVQRNRYAWHHFLKALTDNEIDAFITLRDTNPPIQLKRFLAVIEAEKSIDFNDAKPQQFLTYLVNQNVLTAPRALELRG